MDAVRKVLPWPAEDVTIEPTFVPVLPALRGGEKGGPLLISAGVPVLRSSRTAVVPVTVTASGSGGESRTVEVTLRLKVQTTAVVAARAVSRHAVVGPEDVALARVELAGGNAASPALANVDEVIGKRAARTLLAGRPVTKADVEEAPVFEANARVTVRVLSGAVEITASGTALEEGRPGQMVRVRLLADKTSNVASTGKTVRARVESADTVIVDEQD